MSMKPDPKESAAEEVAGLAKAIEIEGVVGSKLAVLKGASCTAKSCFEFSDLLPKMLR